MAALLSWEERRVLLARPFAYQLRQPHTLPRFLVWSSPSETPVHEGDILLVKVAALAAVKETHAEQDASEAELASDEEAHGAKLGGSKAARTVETGVRIYTMHDEEGRRRFQEQRAQLGDA